MKAKTRKIRLMKNRSSFKLFTTILSAVACFGLLPQMHAILPPEIPGNPDGCYPAFNTAEGCSALFNVTGGVGDTGVGWFSLFIVGDASFNTGVGAAALALTSRVGAGTDANSNNPAWTATAKINNFGQDKKARGEKSAPAKRT